MWCKVQKLQGSSKITELLKNRAARASAGGSAVWQEHEHDGRQQSQARSTEHPSPGNRHQQASSVATSKGLVAGTFFSNFTLIIGSQSIWVDHELAIIIFLFWATPTPERAFLVLANALVPDFRYQECTCLVTPSLTCDPWEHQKNGSPTEYTHFEC